jgi:hypothetical protein
MPHRGRLNVLANVIRKLVEVILNEFSGVEGDEPAGKVNNKKRQKYPLASHTLLSSYDSVLCEYYFTSVAPYRSFLLSHDV